MRPVTSHSAPPHPGRCHDVWMRGRSRTNWWGVVLEAPDGAALARFYASLFGWPIAKQDADGAAIAVPSTSSYLAFQSAPDYVPGTAMAAPSSPCFAIG